MMLGRSRHRASLSSPQLLLLVAFVLLHYIANAAATAAATTGAGAAEAPIRLGGRRDRKACKRALQAVAKQRRRAAKLAEQEARPVVTLAYAQTLDGCLAWAGRHAAAISSPPSLALTHALRSSHECILIGAGTLSQDNPQLNVRLPPRRPWWALGRRRPYGPNPRPVLLVSAVAAEEAGEDNDNDDAALSWLLWWRGKKEPRPLPFDPTGLKLARPPIVFTPDLPQLVRRLGGPAAFEALRLDGWDFVECLADESGLVVNGEGHDSGRGSSGSKKGPRRCDIRDCLRRLRALFGCRSVMVEGGARVLTACLNAGVMDVACVTVAPAMMAPGAGYRVVQGERQRGWLVRFRERAGEVVRVGGDVVVVAVPD